MTLPLLPDLPSTKQLFYFLAIVDEAHFKKAASKCGISQPSLSAQIQLLEEKLGTKLVERSRTGAVLTPAGRETATRARRILRDTQDLVDSIEAMTGQMRGTIRLGVKPTVGPYLMPKIVGLLHQQFPDLKLVIQEGTVAELAERLAMGQLDITLTELPVQHPDFVVTPLYREPLLLALAQDHPFKTAEKITPQMLQGEKVLTLEARFRLHDQVSHLCEDYGADIQRDYVGTSLDALRQMVGMGMGISFLPALYVTSEVSKDSEVAIRQLAAKTIYRRIGFAWRVGAGQVEIYKSIITAARQVAKEISPDLILEKV